MPTSVARPPGRTLASASAAVAGEPTASRAQSAPSGASAASSSGRSAGSQSWVAPTARARARRAGSGSTTTIARCAAQPRALDAELPDAAGADDDDDVARGDLARRADAGQRGAAEQRGLGRGQLVGELEHAARGHHDALGERAHGGHAVDRLAVGREPRRAVGQRAGADARAQRQARGRAAGEAGAALAAGRRPREDHAVADGEAVDVRADRLDDAGALVAEHHRPRPHPLALDDVQVGAADADGVDAHERVARPGPRRGRSSRTTSGAPGASKSAARTRIVRCPGRRQSAAAISADGAISHSQVSA